MAIKIAQSSQRFLLNITLLGFAKILDKKKWQSANVYVKTGNHCG